MDLLREIRTGNQHIDVILITAAREVSTLQEAFVITSYSIHYTKLYESKMINASPSFTGDSSRRPKALRWSV